jgi:isopentenyl-diphosphate delta-isomerase
MDVRKYINNQPFFANLGIAQIEKLVDNKQIKQVQELIKSIQADGLFVHINPLQEAFQPEGDYYTKKPIDTLKKLLDQVDFPVFVKEVGQGFGPKSLKALLNLNIKGIEIAAFGGTNFAKLELLRTNSDNPLAYVGNTIDETIKILNSNTKLLENKNIIISGGIQNALDGYYYIKKLNTNSVYGQAFAFLKNATESFEKLEKYFVEQMQILNFAYSFLEIKK